MSDERFPFRFGSYSCLVLIDGREIRPISTITSSVGPQELAQELEAQGFSPTETINDFNVLFLDTGRNLVLIDAGWGGLTQKIQGRMVGSLREAGFRPEDVDLVVLTHGDRDHIGGLVDDQGQPTFPYASYLIHQAAWDYYNESSNLARMPAEVGAFYRKVLPLLQDNLRLVDQETEFLPGLTLVPAPGHRPGHSIVRLTLSGKHFLHMADTVSHPLLMLHPEWHWPYDSDPEMAAATRRQLLDWAAQNQAMCFGSHLAFPGLGTIRTSGPGWIWEAVEL